MMKKTTKRKERQTHTRICMVVSVKYVYIKEHSLTWKDRYGHATKNWTFNMELLALKKNTHTHTHTHNKQHKQPHSKSADYVHWAHSRQKLSLLHRFQLHQKKTAHIHTKYRIKLNKQNEEENDSLRRLQSYFKFISFNNALSIVVQCSIACLSIHLIAYIYFKTSNLIFGFD